jgi:hypothetical protein
VPVDFNVFRGNFPLNISVGEIRRRPSLALRVNLTLVKPSFFHIV